MAERPEDLNLPNAVITRIIKESIPDGVNISKEARLAISKAASVFILYATSCSNNFAMKAKRKTISALDVISAMEEMEFEEFADPLRLCLDAFRKEKQDKKNDSQKKKKGKEDGNLSTESIPKESGDNPVTIVGEDDDEDAEEVDEGIEEEQEDMEEEQEDDQELNDEEEEDGEVGEMPALDSSDEEDSAEENSD